MSDFSILHSYLSRTGQSAHEMLNPLSNYEFKEIIGLIAEAEERQEKVIFYYESQEDEEMNRYSHRFE